MFAELAPLAGDLASFGAAGLMGALWIWERRLSRARESQLGEAHTALMQDRGLLSVVSELVQRNTAALTGLQETQRQLVGLLSAWRARCEPEKPARP
ncbi:MAG: hypothetical protein BIFFINMI_02912 [Phycisphaerae bacterium]|nr:hypothetical protein [Phycisphaerae bacterium]